MNISGMKLHIYRHLWFTSAPFQQGAVACNDIN
jgi:hypothetical protein